MRHIDFELKTVKNSVLIFPIVFTVRISFVFSKHILWDILTVLFFQHVLTNRWTISAAALTLDKFFAQIFISLSCKGFLKIFSTIAEIFKSPAEIAAPFVTA